MITNKHILSFLAASSLLFLAGCISNRSVSRHQFQMTIGGTINNWMYSADTPKISAEKTLDTATSVSTSSGAASTSQEGVK